MGYLYTRDSLLMVVADGMGGHARGEIASELTLQTIAAMFQRQAKPMLSDPVARPPPRVVWVDQRRGRQGSPGAQPYLQLRGRVSGSNRRGQPPDGAAQRRRRAALQRRVVGRAARSADHRHFFRPDGDARGS